MSPVQLHIPALPFSRDLQSLHFSRCYGDCSAYLLASRVSDMVVKVEAPEVYCITPAFIWVLHVFHNKCVNAFTSQVSTPRLVT